MMKQTVSKRVMVMAMASVMGFSCLVGCNGAKKEEPVTSIQSQQVTPDSKNKAEESTTSGNAKKADDKKSTTDSKNDKDNKKGGTPANNSNTAKSGKTAADSKKK